MAGNTFLDLPGTEPMASNVDHVVGASKDKEVTVFVANTPVKSAVNRLAGNAFPIGVDEACIVLPDGLHEARRCRALDHHHAFFIWLGQLFAGHFMQNFHAVAIHGHTGTAELAGFLIDPIGDGDDGPAGFGLPVVVDDGHIQALVDPACRRFVQRLTRQKQRAQAGQIVLFQQCRVLLAQHAHRRRRAEHGGDLVLLDQAPPDAAVRLAVHALRGQTFVQDARHACNQRPVNDVAVAHNPANVAGGKIGFTCPAVKNVFHARGQGHGIAAGVALHTLGLAGGAAGVDGVADGRGVQPFAGYLRLHEFGAQVMPQQITARHQRHRRQLAVHQQHGLGLVAGQTNGLVKQRLVRNHLAAARTRIGTDDHARRCVFYAGGQRATRKPAEHHTVNRTYARAGKHGKCGFGNHRHVDQHPVALHHAHRFQAGGHALDFLVQRMKAVGFFNAGLA